MIPAASSPSEMPSYESPSEKRVDSAAAGTVMQINGKIYEVIDESVVHTKGKDKDGKTITFAYTACTAREIRR